MPAKDTTGISISLHPKDGVSEFEVGALGRWVGNLKNLTRHALVLEKNKAEGKHVHIALEFSKITDQDNVKDNFFRFFKKSLYTDQRWIENKKRSICIKAHDDICGLVGGYYTKSELPEVISMVGFSDEDLSKGKQRRDVAIVEKDKRTCSKITLIPQLVQRHQYLIEPEHQWILAYEQMTAQNQVQACLEQLIIEGYHNYLLHWTPALERTIIKNWRYLAK